MPEEAVDEERPAVPERPAAHAVEDPRPAMWERKGLSPVTGDNMPAVFKPGGQMP
jgi:hypothetical protein